MKDNRFSLGLVLSLTAFLFIGTTQFPLQSAQAGNAAQDELKNQLTEIASLYLKTKYDVLITGAAPADGLIVEYDGMTRRYRDAGDRLNAAFAERETLSDKYDTRYTNIQVMLFSGEVKVQGDKVVLQATEHTTRHYVSGRLPSNSKPMVTEERLEHYFIFTKRMKSDKATSHSYSVLVELNEYILVEDWIGRNPYADSIAPNAIEPIEGEPPPGEAVDDSTYCCYPEELAFVQPVNEPSMHTSASQITPRSGCAYWGDAAAGYAYLNALDYNRNYRVFDNDCTNFASQALRSGGWSWKRYGQHYKNWSNWWYNLGGSQRSGQSRTWTQAQALHYFLKNSGRGLNTANPCDLESGDIIFADWNNDRKIDHVMVVSNRYHITNCSYWEEIFLSQHSPFRRDKPLSQYAAEVPSAKFYAYWICHNN